MYTTTQSIRPIYTVLGAGFVAEQHADHEQSKLAALHEERRFADFARALSGLVWGETTTH